MDERPATARRPVPGVFMKNWHLPSVFESLFAIKNEVAAQISRQPVLGRAGRWAALARVDVASSTRSGLSATTASMLGSSPPPTRGSDAMLAGQFE